MNKTLLKRVRFLLSNSRLNKSFWTDIVNTTCYIMNRSSSTTIDFKTPIDVWFNKYAKYSMLKVFGCSACYHISEGKLEPRVKKVVFICYGDGIKGFKI